MAKWIRYRFQANEDDWRPVTFPPPGPCWCTGYGDDYSVVVAYLPEGVPVQEYWPEATNLELDEKEKIEFSSRFPKPDWWNP